MLLFSLETGSKGRETQTGARNSGCEDDGLARRWTQEQQPPTGPHQGS